MKKFTEKQKISLKKNYAIIFVLQFLPNSLIKIQNIYKPLPNEPLLSLLLSLLLSNI
jgi:hypothetical protein